MNKHIDEMARFMLEKAKDGTQIVLGEQTTKLLDDVLEQAFIPFLADALVKEGYRKASDVAWEIVNDVKETLLDFHLRENKKYIASKTKKRKQFDIETARYRAITDAVKFAIETLNEVEKKHESEGAE